MIPLTTNGLSSSIRVLSSHICPRQYIHSSAKWSFATFFLRRPCRIIYSMHGIVVVERSINLEHHNSFSHRATHNTKHTTHKQPTMNHKQCTTRIVPFVRARRRFRSQLCTPNCVRDSLTNFQIDPTSIRFQCRWFAVGNVYFLTTKPFRSSLSNQHWCWDSALHFRAQVYHPSFGCSESQSSHRRMSLSAFPVLLVARSWCPDGLPQPGRFVDQSFSSDEDLALHLYRWAVFHCYPSLLLWVW